MKKLLWAVSLLSLSVSCLASAKVKSDQKPVMCSDYTFKYAKFTRNGEGMSSGTVTTQEDRNYSLGTDPISALILSLKTVECRDCKINADSGVLMLSVGKLIDYKCPDSKSGKIAQFPEVCGNDSDSIRFYASCMEH